MAEVADHRAAPVLDVQEVARDVGGIVPHVDHGLDDHVLVEGLRRVRDGVEEFTDGVVAGDLPAMARPHDGGVRGEAIEEHRPIAVVLGVGVAVERPCDLPLVLQGPEALDDFVDRRRHRSDVPRTPSAIIDSSSSSVKPSS